MRSEVEEESCEEEEQGGWAADDMFREREKEEKRDGEAQTQVWRPVSSLEVLIYTSLHSPICPSLAYFNKIHFRTPKHIQIVFWNITATISLLAFARTTAPSYVNFACFTP